MTSDEVGPLHLLPVRRGEASAKRALSARSSRWLAPGLPHDITRKDEGSCGASPSLASVWPLLPVAALASPLGACQESCGLYLHMELVQMLLGSEPNPSTAQLQHAGRKLEAVGFHVGERLVERYTKERPRFSDTLEIIKFICKDFWYEVYRKHIDKLQTNNRARRRRPPPTRSPVHPPARPLRTRSPAAAAAAAAAATVSSGRRAPASSDVLQRLAGGVHASGQQAQADRALLAEFGAHGERQADGRTARQVSGGADPRCARRGEAGRVGVAHSIAPSVACAARLSGAH